MPRPIIKPVYSSIGQEFIILGSTSMWPGLQKSTMWAQKIAYFVVFALS